MKFLCVSCLQLAERQRGRERDSEGERRRERESQTEGQTDRPTDANWFSVIEQLPWKAKLEMHLVRKK